MRILTEKELLTLTQIDTNASRENQLYTLYSSLINNEYIEKRLCTDIESILYSAYFWYIQFQQEYTKNHGKNVSIDQENFKLLEKISYDININWKIIEQIENNSIKENSIVEVSAY